MTQLIDKAKLIRVTNKRYRQNFHIITPEGWLNDPNGLCYFQGYYHVFYQFHPYSAEWGPMHWGHVRSKDLVNWEQLPVALVPGDPEDKGGCFSGSAIVKGNRLYLIYTGHHYYDDGNLDHFWENQNVAYSDDGIHFTKYTDNPIISVPKDNTQHFRDPKVWELDGQYYLVIGSQDKEKLGRILMYKSKDLLNWEYLGPIAKSHGQETEGSMWECPDFFRLNGQDVLICSPMGIKPTEKKYLNVSQTGYFVGQLDYKQPKFRRNNFSELDYGHNFYATQTFVDPTGRRILFGWMSPFDEEMLEKPDGWAGSLTIPRELKLDGDHLRMLPLKEYQQLRTKKIYDTNLQLAKSKKLDLPDIQHSELLIESELNTNDQLKWSLLENEEEILSLNYDQKNGELTLYRKGKDSFRYAQIKKTNQLKLHIFIDTSSVEIFVNDGEAVFTERYYTQKKLLTQFSTNGTLNVNVIAFNLKK